MITSDECENCAHCFLEEISKGLIYVHCNLRDKKYFYGQYVDCSNFTPRKEVEDV